MENSEFKQELQEWANQIIDYCSPIAEKQNLEYYPLQSPLNVENTDVLIIGINPRSNGNHKTQSENPLWEYTEGKMPVERLLKGNPYFSLSNNDWRFFNNLKQIDFLKEIIDSNRFTYMNYFYFSSSDAKQMKKIDGFKDIVAFFRKALIDLIDIIKPKLIIILGVSDGLDIISDIPVSTILKKRNNRILTSGVIYNTKLYAIPHSSRGYAYDVRSALNISLRELFENKNVSPFSFEESNFIPRIDIKKINEILSSYNFQFSDYNKTKGIYKAIYKGIGTDKLDFRLDIRPSQKYIAFRSEKRDFFDLEGKELYKQVFCGKENKSWLVYKNLNYYQANTPIEEQISNDIITLLEKIASH